MIYWLSVFFMLVQLNEQLCKSLLVLFQKPTSTKQRGKRFLHQETAEVLMEFWTHACQAIHLAYGLLH